GRDRGEGDGGVHHRRRGGDGERVAGGPPAPRPVPARPRGPVHGAGARHRVHGGPRDPGRGGEPPGRALGVARLVLVSSLSYSPRKYRSNSSAANRSPSSVSRTDFAFVFGSVINPLAWRRSSASQSCPFHARRTPWSWNELRWRRARTTSSTFFSSYLCGMVH